MQDKFHTCRSAARTRAAPQCVTTTETNRHRSPGCVLIDGERDRASRGKPAPKPDVVRCGRGAAWIEFPVSLSSNGLIYGAMSTDRPSSPMSPGESSRDAEALPEDDQFFRSIFDQSATGIVVVSAQTGRLVRVNGAMCRLTGYSEEELLQKSLRDITHPDDVEASESFMRRLLSGEIETQT